MFRTSSLHYIIKLTYFFRIIHSINTVFKGALGTLFCNGYAALCSIKCFELNAYISRLTYLGGMLFIIFTI